jgi:WD40 repeat protein
MQEIYSLDFSRDGRYLVSGSGDKSARIWDIEKGQLVFDLHIEDFIHNEHGPIDAGITSVACRLKFVRADASITRWKACRGRFSGYDGARVECPDWATTGEAQGP